jgi:hypothetical protein
MMGWSVAPLARGVSRLQGPAGVSEKPFAAMRCLVIAAAAAWVFCSACHDPECEAARLNLVRTWETLRDTATSRKQIPEGASLTQAQEQERIRVWTAIEDRAELVRSSFETSQVTWPSADKARADLGEAFKPLASNEDPMTRGFALTLNEADQQMAAFRKTCR